MKAHIVQTLGRPPEKLARKAVEEAAVSRLAARQANHWRKRSGKLNRSRPHTKVSLQNPVQAKGVVISPPIWRARKEESADIAYCGKKRRTGRACTIGRRKRRLLSTCKHVEWPTAVATKGRLGWEQRLLVAFDGCSFSMPDVDGAEEGQSVWFIRQGRTKAAAFGRPLVAWWFMSTGQDSSCEQLCVARPAVRTSERAGAQSGNCSQAKFVGGSTAFCSLAHFALLWPRGATASLE